MIDLFKSELPGFQLHCGTALTGAGSGRCKNRSCGRQSPTLLGGYCTACAAAKGINPLKACGCKPIVLTALAATN